MKEQLLTAPSKMGLKLKEVSQRQQDGEVWKRIQSEYGAKPKKQREIKKHLDKDDFMKIMITQMQHQDPTNPMDSDKLAAEIAQITSVEQLQNVNTALNKMTEKNKPLERMTMTNLIGKTVTVDENRFTHIAGQNENIRFSLPEDITQGKLTLLSEKGEKVLEKDLGSLKAGPNSINWNGKKSNTTEALTGTYLVRIEAENDTGAPVHASAISKSRIIGVSFEGEDPVFIVGDGRNSKRIKMDSIITIEQGAQPMVVPTQNHGMAHPKTGANQNGTPQQLGLIDNGGAMRKAKQFFAFEKGEGSKPIDLSNIDPETRALLESVKPKPSQHNIKAASDTKKAKAVSPGFANGLGEAVQKAIKGVSQ